MIAAIWNALFNSVWGWLGVGGLIVVGSAAVAYFIPIPKVRRIAIDVAIIAAISTGIYTKGAHDQYVRDKARIERQEQAARQMGEHARADAIKRAADGLRDPFDSDSN